MFPPSVFDGESGIPDPEWAAMARRCQHRALLAFRLYTAIMGMPKQKAMRTEMAWQFVMAMRDEARRAEMP